MAAPSTDDSGKVQNNCRIVTHQFLQCGSFPVQLSRASIHQMLFKVVEKDCLLESFLHLLPPGQREVFFRSTERKATISAEFSHRCVRRLQSTNFSNP